MLPLLMIMNYLYSQKLDTYTSYQNEHLRMTLFTLKQNSHILSNQGP